MYGVEWVYVVVFYWLVFGGYCVEYVVIVQQLQGVVLVVYVQVEQVVMVLVQVGDGWDELGVK